MRNETKNKFIKKVRLNNLKILTFCSFNKKIYGVFTCQYFSVTFKIKKKSKYTDKITGITKVFENPHRGWGGEKKGHFLKPSAYYDPNDC